MKSSRLWLAATAVGLGLQAATATAAPSPDGMVRLPLDRATQVNGIDVACTGVGQTKHDPRWLAYPVRVEFSDSRSEYLGAGEATVSQGGRAILSVHCEAPWILLKLAPGSYKIEGRAPGTQARPRGSGFKAPAKGQIRLVLQFPDL